MLLALFLSFDVTDQENMRARNSIQVESKSFDTLLLSFGDFILGMGMAHMSNLLAGGFVLPH